MIDHVYLADSLASLSGMPVRVFQDGVFMSLHHASRFTPDLALPVADRILENPAPVSYFMTDAFLFFGVLRIKNSPVCFIIGPVAQTPPERTLASHILRSIGESVDRTRELLDYLQAIPRYPLQNFLQMLCTLHYFLNGEKTRVSDLLQADADKDTNGNLQEPDLASKAFAPEAVLPTEPSGENSIHNTYELEQSLLSMVEHGMTDQLDVLLASPTIGRAGTLATNSLRQQKNLFICTTTLVTRAAIRGGLERETAFSLSDVYIQKVELMKLPSEVMRLQVRMVSDFTRRVADATCGEKHDARIRQARLYILQHLNERISTDQLARELRLNRTYLCRLFQEQTGMSAGHYVMAMKLDEAKRLLAISRKTLPEIAACLGFSSQSHFQNAFKAHTGVTPNQYRKQA